MDDFFVVFGLPRRLVVDAADLERRFHALSRQYHPDVHQAAGPSRQAAVLATSALVNRAYRALREPLSRLEYLIALEEGRDGPEGRAGQRTAPAGLLTEMMEVQEALEEARAAGLDEAARRQLREAQRQLRARYEAEGQAILARMSDWDGAEGRPAERRALLDWFKQRLATRAYLRTAIGDLAEALGEDDGSDGPNRRH